MQLCPLPTDVSASELQLKAFAEIIDDVFKANAAGTALTPEQKEWAFLLDSPNTWLSQVHAPPHPIPLHAKFRG